MPYIDNTPALSPYKVYEGNLQEGLKNLLIKHGWTKAIEFKKLVPTVHFVTEHDTVSRHDDEFTVANHLIMRNARGNLLGIAVVADWEAYTDHDQGFPFYNFFISTDSDRQALIDYMVDEFNKNKVETTLYFYVIEKLPPGIVEGDNVLVPWGLSGERDKRLQMAIDVEVMGIDFKSTNAGSEYVKVANPSVMQSPIVESSLRPTFLEDINYPYMDTNWWVDSEIGIRGYIDSNSLFITMQADNAPMWEDNVVPIVPLYFGDMVPMDEGDPGIVLFAGTVPYGSTSTDIAQFNYDDVSINGGRTILPILKSYPSVPSNGIDSVMVNRTKLGARYQSYYLSWNTAPQEMPPTRDNGKQGDIRQYPRALVDKGYQFNPSRYSGKVQTSRIYLVHPEEGVRGYLKNSVGLNAINLNSSELRIRKEDCPERIYDVYQCIPVSAVSPLTKRPATHYRPMGLGIYKEELNLDNPFKHDSNDTTPPANVSNLRATVSQLVVKLNWSNPSDRDFTGVDISVDGKLVVTGVTEVESYVLYGLDKGNHSITVTSVDRAGNKSNGVTVDVTIV